MPETSKQAHFLYSLSSGYNFYEWMGHEKCTIFEKPKSVIRHIKTGELFYITELRGAVAKQFNLHFWISLIRRPADLKYFIWPVDIISWEKDNVAIYALVFPLRAMPKYKKLNEVLSDDQHLGWHQERVKKLVSDFLDAWSGFDLRGYAYHEFSEQNMFYQPDTLNVMFDFSFSTHEVKTLYDAQPIVPDVIMPEYADSLYYSENRQAKMDLASDYYSIAVILFKLLIGRLPYQGAVMEHEPDSTPKEHENWLRIYHNNPYFIFDENDETNRIGGDFGFAKDEIYVKRWNELSQSVRNMFHNVLQTANVLRTTETFIFYSPEQWKEALFDCPKDIPLVYREAGSKEITHNSGAKGTQKNAQLEKDSVESKRQTMMQECKQSEIQNGQKCENEPVLQHN